MSTHLNILAPHEITMFDSPPEFSREERKRFFRLPQWARDCVENLRSPANQIGFVLQYGYFKTVQKFFLVDTYRQRDIQFVVKRRGCPVHDLVLHTYSKTTALRHQEIILDHLGFCKFDQTAQALLIQEASVIDGLMHNEVIQSDIHSTDTHGYSEVIFGTTHLLGISFAPRIKKVTDQTRYSFDRPSTFKALGYPVLPTKTINSALIQEYWDQILQFVATIKLKEATASQLFKRLNSYSTQHPLYRALKQFGRIIKTLFLLKYIDDLTLRQMIERQLNKMESANKFGKAVFYGNNQEFQLSTKEEHLIAEGCKRLIENAIICWNYLYLSKLLYDTDSEQRRNELLTAMSQRSVVTWQHINLHGEYDFSEDTLKDSIEFSLPEVLRVSIT